MRKTTHKELRNNNNNNHNDNNNNNDNHNDNHNHNHNHNHNNNKKRHAVFRMVNIKGLILTWNLVQLLVWKRLQK